MASRLTRSTFINFDVISLLVRPNNIFVRYYASRPRPKPESYLYRPTNLQIVEEVEQNLATKRTYRRHPGILKVTPRVEPDIQNAIGQVLVKGEQISTYKTQGKEMERCMQNRRLPFELHDVQKLRHDIELRLRKSEAKKGWTSEAFEKEERQLFEEKIQKECDRRLKTSLYTWEAMLYNSPSKCMTYCVMRFAPEYAVLRRVFHEIVKRAPDFKPKSVLDFGSGVGTTFFATEKVWESTVEEYLCVDSSQDMTDLFHLLLRDGVPENQPRHPNVTFRPFLPATSERRYDLVVSSYSLFEMPSYEDRMRVIANLWLKTDQFLVLIERGTNAGYRAVLESRDYVLAGAHEIYRKGLVELASNGDVDLAEVDSILKGKEITEAEKFRLLREKYPGVEFPTILPHGHVFAPCPHDMGCPRLMDVTPCNFSVRYFPLRLSGHESEPREEIFSFIILRKGYAPSSADRWPRVVREPRKSSNCVWCQMCSPHGVLEDVPFHKGPTTTERGIQFRLAKKISWGDLLPVATSYDVSATSAAEALPATGTDGEIWDEDAVDDDEEEEDEFEEDLECEETPKENLAPDKDRQRRGDSD